MLLGTRRSATAYQQPGADKHGTMRAEIIAYMIIFGGALNILNM